MLARPFDCAHVLYHVPLDDCLPVTRGEGCVCVCAWVCVRGCEIDVCAWEDSGCISCTRSGVPWSSLEKVIGPRVSLQGQTPLPPRRSRGEQDEATASVWNSLVVRTPPRRLGVGVVLGEGDFEPPPGQRGEVNHWSATQLPSHSPDLHMTRGEGPVSSTPVW